MTMTDKDIKEYHKMIKKLEKQNKEKKYGQQENEDKIEKDCQPATDESHDAPLRRLVWNLQDNFTVPGSGRYRQPTKVFRTKTYCANQWLAWSAAEMGRGPDIKIVSDRELRQSIGCVLTGNK